MRALEPVQLAGLHLRNRIAVAAMSRMQSHDDGTVAAEAPAYYARYAANGAGLVFTEALHTDDTSARAYWNQPGLSRDTHVEGWKCVTDAVHAQGGRIFAQLQHGGRLAEPGVNPRHLAPVAGTAAGTTWQTARPNAPAQAASREDIEAIVAAFAAAARRAKDAGFDGVELHGARGYLLDGFLSASTNTRSDDYGGSLENRLRLPLEAVRATRAAIGPLPLSYNLSLYKMDDTTYQPPGGREEIRAITRALVAAGVDLLHVTTRRVLRAEPWGEPLAATVAAESEVPVICNGGLKTVADCEEALRQTGCEMVSLARAWLAEPDWLRLSLGGEALRSYQPGLERAPLLRD